MLDSRFRPINICFAIPGSFIKMPRSAKIKSSTSISFLLIGSCAACDGLALRSNAGATVFLAVEYTSTANGSLELWKFNGAWTNLAKTTGLYPGGVTTAPAALTLRAEASTPIAPATATTVRCYLGGTLRLTFTLTAADQGTFSAAAQTYVGPYTYSDATSTFDNFHVDTP